MQETGSKVSNLALFFEMSGARPVAAHMLSRRYYEFSP